MNDYNYAILIVVSITVLFVWRSWLHEIGAVINRPDKFVHHENKFSFQLNWTIQIRHTTFQQLFLVWLMFRGLHIGWKSFQQLNIFYHCIATVRKKTKQNQKEMMTQFQQIQRGLTISSLLYLLLWITFVTILVCFM